MCIVSPWYGQVLESPSLKLLLQIGLDPLLVSLVLARLVSMSQIYTLEHAVSSASATCVQRDKYVSAFITISEVDAVVLKLL
mmetsp:Transcript_12842/g.17747  ORF Transcript_12842/g.17747 Transcript_12842/m.17747 type:complete len:82 (+) Transcript_12842:211-456(+)